jgi:hypothetical protein
MVLKSTCLAKYLGRNVEAEEKLSALQKNHCTNKIFCLTMYTGERFSKRKNFTRKTKLNHFVQEYRKKQDKIYKHRHSANFELAESRTVSRGEKKTSC